MQKTKYSKKEAGVLKKLIICSLVSLILFPAVSLAFGIVIFNTDDPTGKIKLFSLLSFLTSGIISGFMNSKICRGNMKLKVFSALLAALIFLLISLVASAGKIPGATLINLAVYLCIVLLFSTLKAGGRNSRKRRIK